MALPSVTQFKNNTHHRVYGRSAKLKKIDGTLFRYHQELLAPPHKDKAYYILRHLEFVSEAIDDWAADYNVIVRDGLRRYNNYRDHLGEIYRLRCAVDAALVLAKLADRIEHAGLLAQEKAKDKVGLIVGSRGSRNSFPLALPGGRVTSEQYILGARDSVSSGFKSNTDRHSNQGGEDPLFNGAGGFLGAQAFHAVSEFLKCGLQVNWPAANVEEELVDITNGVTRNNTTMSALFHALDQNYGNLFFRQHCSLESLIHTMSGALPNKPVMVVVGGQTPPYRLVVVKKKNFCIVGDATKPVYVSNDGTLGADGDRAFIYGDGRFEMIMLDKQTVINETLMPHMGVIKFMS